MKSVSSVHTASVHTESQNGCLFIVSAPSGAGKSTLCKAALSRFPDLLYSISHTTRKQRDGEKNGVDYYFVSAEEFKRGIESGQWLEWARVHDNYYGTSADFIKKNLARGRSILLDIDVAGARQILSRLSDCITIFIMPPSLAVLKERLEARKTDSPETIATRLKNAEAEIAQKEMYQHIIVNDCLPEAIARLAAIIESCKSTGASHK